MLAYAFDSFAVDGALTFANRGGGAGDRRSTRMACVAVGREPVVVADPVAGGRDRRAGHGRLRPGGAGLSARRGRGAGAGRGGAAYASRPRVPLVLSEGEARAIAERALSEGRIARDSLALRAAAVAARRSRRAISSRCRAGRRSRSYRIDRIEEAGHRAVSAVRIEAGVYEAPVRVVAGGAAPVAGRPVAGRCRVPRPAAADRGRGSRIAPHVAVARVAVGRAGRGLSRRTTTMATRSTARSGGRRSFGTLLDPLPAGTPGALDARPRSGFASGRARCRAAARRTC